jgi:hypothetical protein
MTKPTGRPRGRPKTKAYVTLMARVDIALADEVKRYASRSNYQSLWMVGVSLYVEAYASIRPSFLHEIISKTMRSGIASQSAFTSYKLL